MNSLYWFNPENDLALAAGLTNYTPPRAAIALRRGGALLPSLWTDSTDRILVVDPTEPAPQITRSTPENLTPVPWGWSPYTLRTLRACGADADALPTPDDVENVRQLSHRAIATRVLAAIDYPESLLPRVACSLSETMEAIDAFGGDCVLKLPWSCSGRGIVTTAGKTNLATLVMGMLNRQGSITIEPRYQNKLNDFATLFFKEGNKVEFQGLSLFSAGDSGQYAGNVIAPQWQLQERIGVDLAPYIKSLTSALSVQLEGYDGWIGVDMLSYRSDDGVLKVAPCIEVNLRFTMGVAALLASRSGKLPWENAVLRVALPGERIPENAIALSATEPSRSEPLAWPCVVVYQP
ncbi:MAG: hypothetical protein NC338_04815 [Firmicutes bacterium]|nr:hypothetical protein [Bacillota bacterium]MCM1401368.1 hypothetical protein [Bacteroides sp.]MCM1477393.1 hypothetical protein [Bacteroides sp.]